MNDQQAVPAVDGQIFRGQSLGMSENDLRVLVRESNLKPVRISMDDGKNYTISHPDFGFVVEGAIIIRNGPGHEIDGAGFVICLFHHITRVEQMKGRESKVA